MSLKAPIKRIVVEERLRITLAALMKRMDRGRSEEVIVENVGYDKALLV